MRGAEVQRKVQEGKDDHKVKDVAIIVVSWMGVAICMASTCILVRSGHEYLAVASTILAALCIPIIRD